MAATLVTRFRVLTTARVMEMSLSVDHLKWLLLHLLFHLMRKICTSMIHLKHPIHTLRVTCTNCQSISMPTATKFHFSSVKRADASLLMIWITSANAKMDLAALFVNRVSSHLGRKAEKKHPPLVLMPYKFLGWIKAGNWFLRHFSFRFFLLLLLEFFSSLSSFLFALLPGK